MNIKCKIVILFIAYLTITSCSDKRDFETYFIESGLELIEPYKVDSINQYGFTDWTLEAYVEISKNETERIINILKTKLKFEKVNSKKEYFDSLYVKGNMMHGFIMDTKYFWGIYMNRYDNSNDKGFVVGYKTYELSVDTLTNKMYFKYEYE